MRMQPGLAGRMFSTLGRATINVLAIAQGASETNISTVVNDDEVERAVRALHEAFALGHDRAHLFIIGTGVVGGELLSLLDAHAPVLLETMDLNFRLAGLANSRRGVLDPEGLSFGGARERLDTADTPSNDALQAFVDSHLERRIIVDTTASEEIARRYPDWLARGISVVTPNKIANTFEQAFYDRLHHLARHPSASYRYETTVGAALPVLSALRDLLHSGDQIGRIEGVLSGTLAFVFNAMAGGRAFSEAVRDARARGFTEPDPRQDLRGEDVARKLLILAREAGLKVERAEISVESLVPAHLEGTSVGEFMERLGEADETWAKRSDAATRDGRRLQYVARMADGALKVGVQALAPDSPFYHLTGTDNMIIFTTARYHQNPLVIRGAGAGPEVTAAGILADLVKVVGKDA
jgi:aspartokinase/homoserine dehydrogenase 1